MKPQRTIDMMATEGCENIVRQDGNWTTHSQVAMGSESTE
jgi:hypothetical protein